MKHVGTYYVFLTYLCLLIEIRKRQTARHKMRRDVETICAHYILVGLIRHYCYKTRRGDTKRESAFIPHENQCHIV